MFYLSIAPRNVQVKDVTENSMKVCWSTPLHGNPDGYLILFSSKSPIFKSNQLHRGKLNLTLDQLEMVSFLTILFFSLLIKSKVWG